jgi:hypothetical protein
MATLVTGLFRARSSAEHAIEDLVAHGWSRDDISLLMSDATHSDCPNTKRNSITSKSSRGGFSSAFTLTMTGRRRPERLSRQAAPKK